MFPFIVIGEDNDGFCRGKTNVRARLAGVGKDLAWPIFSVPSDATHLRITIIKALLLANCQILRSRSGIIFLAVLIKILERKKHPRLYEVIVGQVDSVALCHELGLQLRIIVQP
jgi:hypothetical protein